MKTAPVIPLSALLCRRAMTTEVIWRRGGRIVKTVRHLTRSEA